MATISTTLRLVDDMSGKLDRISAKVRNLAGELERLSARAEQAQRRLENLGGGSRGLAGGTAAAGEAQAALAETERFLELREEVRAGAEMSRGDLRLPAREGQPSEAGGRIPLPEWAGREAWGALSGDRGPGQPGPVEWVPGYAPGPWSAGELARAAEEAGRAWLGALGESPRVLERMEVPGAAAGLALERWAELRELAQGEAAFPTGAWRSWVFPGENGGTDSLGGMIFSEGERGWGGGEAALLGALRRERDEAPEMELQKLRDLAEREAVNRFTTAEVKVEMVNHNTVRSEADLDQLADLLSDKVAERLEAVAEGVYT